ncbi:pyridoxal phosphate-dependent decarboxylase family protein [Bacillus mesophilum]|uniref:Aspartate aminotransferase family protein n=1 Tax=Bacillus mesophilum TaxID=1071718 RepID=A0A7V7RL29_9BACI|nr:pyridoxal-dependent decarboxylase [Bacillus mesophilum]KAB2332042.1 aspartate aminotransferase family protein [Bacillus mesophilum]
MEQLQQLFPSADGNQQQRDELLGYFRKVLTRMDELKDPSKLTLGEMPDYSEDYYNKIIQGSFVPEHGVSVDETIDKLMELVEGHRFLNSNYVANATPLPNIASILGNLVMVLLNGNNLWDVDGSAAANAEVRITSMLSKMIGYDQNESAGYTTWGGQGAVFNSLRLSVARRFPESNKNGIPNNLYCFCSELSHFSLYKSAEATGIGVDHMIRVKVNDDHSMNLEDLKEKMEMVIEKGGIPVYVLATLGTTDTFGIDDLYGMKQLLTEIEAAYDLDSIYVHADSAMGGMYTFFNDYNFSANPLNFEDDVLRVLSEYHTRFKHMNLADSMVFDFHKLGQTPYITSLFLIKDRRLLEYVDLDASETPYVGNRGYGSYHTSYTLECSRMGSSIAIYASLLAFGIEGYQQLLANYLSVNIAFRNRLLAEFPNAAVTNEVSPVTTFRFYPEAPNWRQELAGHCQAEEIREVNNYNEEFAELIGLDRDVIFFGNTKKQRYISAKDSEQRLPVYVHKFYTTSPYSTVEEVDRYIEFLKSHMEIHQKSLMLV